MTKNKDKQRNKIGFFVFIFVTIFFAMSTAIGADWVEPSVDPPGGNVEPPINQGTISQYKLGGLTVGTNIINEDNVLNVSGKSSFIGGLLQASGGVLINTTPMTIDGVNINMTNGAGLNVNNGTISLSNDKNNLNGIYLTSKGLENTGIYVETYGDSSSGIYVFDGSGSDSMPIYTYSESNIAIRGDSISNAGILGTSINGVGVWGSSPLFSGRFDGPVVFRNYDDSGVYGVVVENGGVKIGGDDTSANKGDLYVSRGISTVSKEEVVTNTGNPAEKVYADNTIVTDSLCLGATSNNEYKGIDEFGNPIGGSCRTMWPGPEDENSFIWNADFHRNLLDSSAYQTGSIRIDGKINNAISFDNNNVSVEGELLVIEDVFNIKGTLTAESGITVSGGIMMNSGDLNVVNHRIINVPSPGSTGYESDAVPKSYVDSLISDVNGLISDSSFWEIDETSGSLQPTDSGLRALFIPSLENNVGIMSKVGIGTTTPNRALHVYKEDGDNAEIDIQSVAGEGNHWGIYNERSDNSLKFWKYNNNVLTLQSDGGVKIDELSGGTSNRCLYVNSNGVINASTDDCGSFSSSLLAISCNPGGVQDVPTRALQIGNSSYIYDSSCSGLPELGQTLHIQSGEEIDINATDKIDLKVNGANRMQIRGSGEISVLGYMNIYNGTEYSKINTESNGLMKISTPNGASNSIQILSGVNTANLTSEAITLKTNQTIGNTDELLQIANASTNLFTVMGSGNIGIGTNSPNTKLQIFDATSGPIISLKGDDENYRGLKIQDLDNNEQYFVGANDVGDFVIKANGDNENLAPIDMITIPGGAFLQVGTVWNHTTLKVYGDIKLNEGFDSSYIRADSPTSDTIIYVANMGFGDGYDLPQDYWFAYGTSTTNLTNETASLYVEGDVRANKLCIRDECRDSWNKMGQWTTLGSDIYYNTGNVGIGVTNPLGKLVIKGNSNTTGIGFQTQNLSGSPLVTILNNGQVGIGTTAPAEGLKLEIGGNVLISGGGDLDIGAGSELCIGTSCLNEDNMKLQCPPRRALIIGYDANWIEYIAPVATYSACNRFFNRVELYGVAIRYNAQGDNISRFVHSTNCEPFCRAFGFHSGNLVTSMNGFSSNVTHYYRDASNQDTWYNVNYSPSVSAAMTCVCYP